MEVQSLLIFELVIFRLQSWYTQDVAQSQSLELGQATHSTVPASISPCTQGIGARESEYGQDTHLHQGDGMHLWVLGIRHSHRLPMRRRGSDIIII